MSAGSEKPAAPSPGAAVTGSAVSEPGRARSPVQIQIPTTEERSSVLKTFTVYIIHVSDFGRSYQIERRFDDFAKLHAELVNVDPSLPPIPEKKMWASTDASTVAERRPAFERILRHMLRSEAVVMEESKALWKFLEIPTPGAIAARYVLKSPQRQTYARQCAKLVDPKFEKEHAYRLAHEALIKTSLQLLSSEPTSAGKPARKDPPKGAAAADSAGVSSPEAAELEAKESPAASFAEAEASALEMLRWAIANGGESARRTFLDEGGYATMLRLLFRKGREAIASAKDGGKSAAPHPQIRTVLNALVKAEGDKYPQVFAEFLAKGGVTLLSGVKDITQHSQGFSEFISKLLWIAWDFETQRAFLSEEHDREALGLLSALFECPSRTARVCAGLLLSSLLASGELLAGKEAQAAGGVYSLVEEMVALSPVWNPDAAAKAGDAEAEKAEADLAAFVQTLGQNEERLGRILSCADAPWRLNGGNLPTEDSPLWASCAFALWCLLKLRPKPNRLANLRLALPAVCQVAPPRVRWLAGELMLLLQLQSPTSLSDGGQFGSIEAVVDVTFQESTALEVSLREQVEHTRQSLRADLEHNQSVISSQRQLTEERRCEVQLAKTAWHRPLDDVLNRLVAARESLTGALGTTESRSEKAMSAVRDVLQLELGDPGSESDERDLSVKLDGMREVESSYLAKKQEFDQYREAQAVQDKTVEDANAAMEQADKAVQDTRRQISDLEAQISTKQREVQSKRTMASSDFSALKGQLMAEMDTIKVKQAKLRERAMKIQNGEPVDGKSVPLDAAAAAEEMARLKAESAQLKARSAELQSEQSRMDVDPATLEQQALAAEESVQQLCRERDGLRSALHGLEHEHSGAREAWQAAMTDLQVARQRRNAAERECSGLRQQLDTMWATWRPLHAKRLQLWRGRVLSLSQARQGGRQLGEAVGSGWDGLRSERDIRAEVLGVVQELQGQLSALANELVSVDDRVLESLGGT
mmetsp:Transcript_65450/g.188563  ORF Transcript_65450/g.188563 Transcript_65450/m.188563 type:complete len:990 (-) Transcript_65450:77-3046(-)